MKTSQLFYLFFGFLISCSERSELAEEDIPTTVPRFEVLVNSEDAFDGYIFLRKTENPGAQFMINNEGKIVWFQLSDTTIIRVYTAYEESYIALYSPKEIHEITYDGDTLLKLTYGVGGFDRTLHHEILLDGDKNIIALTKELIPIDLSKFGGEKQDTIKTDGIIKLSSTGEKLWSWSLENQMDPLTYPEINKYKRDWAHANALAIDKDGHYLISWRDFNQVWKIDSETGDLIWKYGSETISQSRDKFYGQHAVHLNLDGDYMMLDNGKANIRRNSRAIAFNISGDSIRNTLTIDFPDSLFTVKQGNVQQFAKDRFLFSSTMRKLLAITNRKGHILWLARSDHEFYRAYYLNRDVL